MKAKEVLMQFTVDKNNKAIRVSREFSAPVSRVWAAWTESKLLDQWWAPKPWQAKTSKMDFREGGYWLYAMVGPDGDSQWCRANYRSIIPLQRITSEDAFCDEKGNMTMDFPRPIWTVQFKDHGETTLVKADIQFVEQADMDQYIEMGFRDGFTAALDNLDKLLGTQVLFQ